MRVQDSVPALRDTAREGRTLFQQQLHNICIARNSKGGIE